MFFSIASSLFFSLLLLVMITLRVMILIIHCHCFFIVLLGHALLVSWTWCGMKGSLLNFYLDDLMKWIKPFKGERDKIVNGWCWSFSFLMAKSDFCLHCRFMVLKKWVMLHLYIFIRDDKWIVFCLLLLIFFGYGEAWREVLVVEFNEGSCNKGNQMDTFLMS